MDGPGSLTRFLFDSNEFRGNNALAKAFFSKFDHERRRSETSVFRTDGMETGDVWHVATEHVEPPRGRTAVARAIIGRTAVESAQLTVETDEPPQLHAVIVGWPEGDENKAQRKSISQVLASKASVAPRSVEAPADE